jgi:double-stranded uracil-DNA glycosylase
MKILPDYLSDHLDLLSIGLNPSPTAVRTGVYFAHPRNRFWPAARMAGLIPPGIEATPEGLHTLLANECLGFTDVVKRSTSSASDLRAADYRAGAPLLLDKITRYKPLIAWFHGRQAYRNFLRYTTAGQQVEDWGLQTFRIGSTGVFVSPNPSPANASYTLAVLIEYYRELHSLRQHLAGGKRV